jgi:hypothetical protein
MRWPTCPALFTIALGLASVPLGHAQVRASERGMVAQTVDGTTITVEYARPQARGRKVFGEVVHWGEVWTPGANWATTLTVDRDVTLDAHPVPTGKYSVWIVPNDGAWTVLLHPYPKLFHTQRPKADEAAVSFMVTPRQGEHQELLTFAFTDVAADGTTLRMHWGTTWIPLSIKVPPTRYQQVTPEQAVPYLGTYSLIMTGEDGKDMPPAEVEVVHRGGTLRLEFGGGWAMQLMPTGTPHRFLPAFLDKDIVVDVEEVPALFTVEGGRATRFLIMGIGDDIWMRATRVK